MASFLSYYCENCRYIGGASYGHDIRKFEKKVDAFANVVWWSTCQQILKRIGQPCFRIVLHGFLRQALKYQLSTTKLCFYTLHELVIKINFPCSGSFLKKKKTNAQKSDYISITLKTSIRKDRANLNLSVKQPRFKCSLIQIYEYIDFRDCS